jgi:hypothetical protein
MKGAILYLLFTCSLFLGARLTVLAGSHAGKTTHCLVNKQLNDDGQVIEAEDQDEEDFLSRKVTAGKWLSFSDREFTICDIHKYSKDISSNLHSYSGNIYIVHRVLRL